MSKIISYKDTCSDSKNFGNKASGLLFLQNIGFNVPDFYLLDYLCLDSIATGALKFSELVSEWRSEYSIKADSLWAIRSSTGKEDGLDQSYAGLFHTSINVTADNVAMELQKVYDSYSNVEASQDNLSESTNGIILQEMISPDYSGVIFSSNPVNLRDNTPIINIIPGLGEKLVSGESEGLNIRWHRGKATTEGHNEIYKGYLFAGTEKQIEKRGDEILVDTSNQLKRLVNGTIRLARIKRHPVDIEFCISDGQLYWLQIRPITALAKSNLNIWDNANIGDNYPGLSLPLTLSYVSYTYARAYKALAQFLGMNGSSVKKNAELFENMTGGINGAIYYNVTAWQQLLYQLPFRKWTSAQLTRIWDMDKVDFIPPDSQPSPGSYIVLLFNIVKSFLLFQRYKKKFESIYKSTLSEYNVDDLKSMSHSELLTVYKDIDNKLAANWVVPVLNGFFLMLLYTLLKRAVKSSKLESKHPGFINNMLGSQQDVESAKLVNSFRLILTSVYKDNKLLSLFRSGKPEDIRNIVRSDYSGIMTLIESFIRDYGERCEGGELKMETVNYREDPLSFFSVLKMNLREDTRFTAERNEVFDYKKLVKETYRFRLLRRAYISWLITKTTALVKNRENHRFMRLKGFHLIRMIFRNMDRCLLEDKYIDSSGDSLYLELRELLDSGKFSQFRQYIKSRKSKYLTYRESEIYNRYIQSGHNFTPQVQVEGEISDTFKGIGCCAGRVIGRVVVLDENGRTESDYSGSILIARFLEPGLIGLFARASGIICERGNLLSHSAILCRELGIPSIVGARGIIKSVRKGQSVHMDGITGDINLIAEEDE